MLLACAVAGRAAQPSRNVPRAWWWRGFMLHARRGGWPIRYCVSKVSIRGPFQGVGYVGCECIAPPRTRAEADIRQSADSVDRVARVFPLSADLGASRSRFGSTAAPGTFPTPLVLSAMSARERRGRRHVSGVRRRSERSRDMMATLLPCRSTPAHSTALYACDRLGVRTSLTSGALRR